MTLSHIFIYPIKSLGGISVSQANLTDRGLEHDRRWLLVEPDGRFITQRQNTELALLQVDLQGTGCRVSHKVKQVQPLTFPFVPETNDRMQVQVFKDQMPAVRVSDAADQWFSSELGTACHLVHMPDDSHRLVDPAYALQNDIVSFADGYPTNLISQASLDHLNEKLEIPIGMDRFRPNFVVKGTHPHAEDEWGPFMMGGIRFIPAKPCGRCVIPTIDQETSEKSKEPTQTLLTYRKQGNKVNFGMNLLHEGVGELRVGMTIHQD
ncbi:MAG: MOSC N-terminal beta barrel domain-containing protein [Bacteroidota bacterium]